jgi:cytochrome c556
MNRLICIIALLGLAVIAGTAEPETTIMEMMVATITPATDTLWGVDDPQTDEEWQVLDDAARTVIETFEKTRQGGSGPNDTAWASEAKFQAYIDEEIAAGEAARAAIAARDLDALFEAGDSLYTPCETCHIDYNPGVDGEQY